MLPLLQHCFTNHPYIMFNRVNLFIVALSLPLFFACQQGFENVSAQESEASLRAKPVLTSQKSTEKSWGALPALGFLPNGKCQSAEAGEAGATDIVFKSVDGGKTWQDLSAGLPKDLIVSCVLLDGNELVLSRGRSYFSINTSSAASAWKRSGVLDFEITDIFQGQNGPFLGSYRNGFFKEIPGTGVLIPMHNNLKDKTVWSILETADGVLFAGCESGLYKSTDAGNSWKEVYTSEGVYGIVPAEGVLICGTHEGLIRSADGGEHWDLVLEEDGSAFEIGYFDGHFVSVTQGGKRWQDHPQNRLRISADAGKTWQRMDESLASVPFVFEEEHSPKPIQNIRDIKKAGKYLFCSCDAGVFRSADWGRNWEPVFALKGDMPFQLAVSGDVVYLVKMAGC